MKVQTRINSFYAVVATLVLLLPLITACGASKTGQTGGATQQPTSAPPASTAQSTKAAVPPTTAPAASATTAPMASATAGPSATAAVPTSGAATAGPTATTAALKFPPLSSLSPSIPEPKSPVTITFESWIQGATLQKLYSQFHKLHPNITVKFITATSDNEQDKLTTQIAGGNAPDTAYVDAGWVQDFADKNALVNLDPYIAKSKAVDPNDYVTAWRKMATYNGHMYGLPFDGETTGLFYRTDLFKAAGITHPPKTWAEFKADAQKLTQPSKKQYGFAIFAPEASYYFLSWLWQAGGRYISPDGKHITLDTPQAKKAAEFYVGLRKYSPPDLYNSNSYDARTAFATGKVAMYVAGAWFAGEMAGPFKKDVKNNWSAAPLPCDVRCANQIAGDSLVMFSQSKNRDAAWKWIEFLAAPQNMLTFNIGTKQAPGTLLPPRKSLLANPALYKYMPVLRQFAAMMKTGEVVGQGTNLPSSFFKIDTILNDELGKAIYGQETADQAMENATKQGQAILDRSQGH